MSAYIIADLRVFDPSKFEHYKVLSTAAVKAHAGRFLIRGGRFKVVEGEWTLNRVTVIEFPSWEAAMAFVRSAEYAQARKARQDAASVQMTVINGV